MASDAKGRHETSTFVDYTRNSPWIPGGTVTFWRESCHAWTNCTIIAVYSCTFSICLLLSLPSQSVQQSDIPGQQRPRHEENEISAQSEFVVLKFLDFRWLTISRHERALKPWNPWMESQYLTSMSGIVHCPQVMGRPIKDIQYRGLSRIEKAAQLERQFADIRCLTNTDTIDERGFRDVTHHDIADAKTPFRSFPRGLSQLLCISDQYITASPQTSSAINPIKTPKPSSLHPTAGCASTNGSQRSSISSGSSNSQTSSTYTSPTRECFPSFNDDVVDTAEECSREYCLEGFSMPAEIDHIVEREDEHLHEYTALCILSSGKALVAPQLIDHVTVIGPTFQEDHGHHVFEFPGVLLEHLPGRTLRDLLLEKVEIAELLAIQRAIVKAVHTLYEHGMYYADYHGGNIIMDLISDYPSPQYHAAIIDYGRWRHRSTETEQDPEMAVVDMMMNDYTGSDAAAARESLEDHVSGRFADYSHTPGIHTAWHVLMKKLIWEPAIELGDMEASSWEVQYERSRVLCRIMAEEFLDRYGADDDEQTLNWILEVIEKISPRFRVTEAQVMTWVFQAQEDRLDHETSLTAPHEAVVPANH